VTESAAVEKRRLKAQIIPSNLAISASEAYKGREKSIFSGQIGHHPIFRD